jgi:glycosyltransferase involved in cell wall biosynthesis
VCVRNRAAILGECLKAVVANHPREIVIVDGQSRDDTVTIARRFTDRVISDGGAGLAIARQLGAEQALGPYVAYVDSDVMLSNGCLDALAAALSLDPGLAAVHARVDSWRPTTYWARGLQARMDLLTEYTPGEKQAVGCMAVIVRRDVILDVRFDPYFVGAAEDDDFFRRVRGAGWRLLVDPAVAYHSHRPSFIEFFKQRMWYGRGHVRLAIKGVPKARRGLILHPLNRLGAVFLVRALRQKRFDLVPFIALQVTAHYAGIVTEFTAIAASKLRRSRVRPEANISEQ